MKSLKRELILEEVHNALFLQDERIRLEIKNIDVKISDASVLDEDIEQDEDGNYLYKDFQGSKIKIGKEELERYI